MLFRSVGSADLTHTGTYSSTSKNAGLGTCVEYNGTNYYSTSTSTDLYITTNEITISLWIYLDQLPSTLGHACTLVRQGTTPQYSLTIDSTDHITFYVYYNGSGGYYGVQKLPAAIAVSTWYHIVAICKANETVKVYINNADANNWWSNTFKYNFYSASGSFLVGGLSSSGYSVDGRIDELGLWNRVLSTDEISTLYASGNGIQYPFV